MKFQITATLLEACVLSLLDDGPAYGYIITQRLQDKVECSESTLYPVLRRLELPTCVGNGSGTRLWWTISSARR